MIIKNGDVRNIALVTGNFGTGKSTLLINDITDVAKNTNDVIIIIDEFGEYKNLVQKFNGKIINVEIGSDFSSIDFSNEVVETHFSSRIVCFSLREVPEMDKRTAYYLVMKVCEKIMLHNSKMKIKTRVYFEDMSNILTAECIIDYFSYLIKISKPNNSTITFIMSTIRDIRRFTNLNKMLPNLILVLFHTYNYELETLVEEKLISKELVPIIKFLNSDQGAEIRGSQMIVFSK
jgi:hypothetical protein